LNGARLRFKFIFLLSSIYLYSQSFLLSQNLDDKTIAIINDIKISLSEFTSRYTAYISASGIKDNLAAREAVLDNMINDILLCYFDSKENILNNVEYNKELKESGKMVILAYLKEQEIYAKISVSDAEIRDAFQKANEQIAARHLYARTEEEANNLYELAKTGVDFSLLAKQVFTDSVLKNNGGYLGYFSWGDMDPAFEDAAYSLKVGEISSPVKTEYGYSIIKVEDKISNPLLTESEFQEKKPHMENVVKLKKKELSERDYIRKIFDNTQLKFNNKIINKILTNLNNRNKTESTDSRDNLEECVRYKDKIYSLMEIEQRIIDLPSVFKNKISSVENLKAAIEGMILNEILFNVAVSKGYDTVQVVKEKIMKYEINLFLKFKKEEVLNNSQLPDSVLQKFYSDNIYMFSTEPEINLQEILVNNELLADSLVKMLNDRFDFGELAKKYSLRKWTAENNGIMGYAPVSKFGSYKDLFWNAQVGTLIGPVKIENMFGLFKLLGKKDSKPINFNEVKVEVENKARLENQNEILQNYLNEIRSQVNIKINDELLRSAVVRESIQ
jgi:parvulin-like peptidyl-prolyl isomerase